MQSRPVADRRGHAEQAAPEQVTSFGALLKRSRQQAGLTQEALAERAGLSVRGIQDLERGLTRPHKDTVRRLLGALDAPQEDRARLEAAGMPVAQRRSTPEATAPARHDPPVVAPRYALPVALTSLIGRGDEVTRLASMLRDGDLRLLTLTGPGGIGKTRLALAVAAALQPDFPDGVVFVGLATLAEPALLPGAIARALDLREAGGLSLQAAVIEALRGTRLLLVLDNFEHLPRAAPTVADLLVACPGVTALVTSRSPLHLRGEHEHQVAPLSLPDPADLVTPQALARCASVALFVDRAQAIQPRFALTEANAASVAALCALLDGLPLAIELAAARIRSLTPQALRARLGRRLPLLTGGPRDLPERQQTLRGAIGWSYDLLAPNDQALFRRLAVFAGGWTLEHAEALCRTTLPGEAGILDALERLTAASLVRTEQAPAGDGAAQRFGMLETIREYGLEQAEAHGELGLLRRRHAGIIVALATAAREPLLAADPAWLARLEHEQANLRAAFDWALEAGDAALGLRVAAGIWRFWFLQGHLTEGRRWLQTFLSRTEDAQADLLPARADALCGSAALAGEQGESGTAALEAALAIYRALGDDAGIVTTLNLLGVEERTRGNSARARAQFEEGLARARAIDFKRGIASILINYGALPRDEGDYARAAALFEEGLALLKAEGFYWGVALSLTNLGELARLQRDPDRARLLYAEGLKMYHELGATNGIAECLEGMAAAALMRRQFTRAARLYAAADRLAREIGATPGPRERALRQQEIETLRAAMDGAARDDEEPASAPFARAWAAGATLTLEAAIAAAMEGAMG